MTLGERLFGVHAEMVSDVDFRLLLASSAVAALANALVSPVLGSLTGPFGVTPAEIGLMVTAITAPPVVIIPLLGLLTDRVGRKPVLVAGLCCFGFAGLAITLTTDFRVVLALRVLQGVGFSGIIPVAITTIGDLYVGEDEATAQGIRFASSGVSQAGFPVAAGVLVASAWQYPFLLYGLALPVAVALVVFLEEPANLEPSGGPLPDGSYVSRLGRLATRPRVLAYMLARGVVVLPFIAFLTYNSLVVGNVLGGSASDSGLLVALYSVVYAVAATQTGRLVARFDGTTGPLISANVLLGGGLIGFALSPSLWVAAPAVATMGVGTGVGFSLFRTVVTGLAPSELRGGLVSVTESFGRLVATLTPLAIGGAIAVMEPAVGLSTALRWIIASAGGLAAVVGVASVLLAWRSAPVPEAPAP